jgi:hypothetical protein
VWAPIEVRLSRAVFTMHFEGRFGVGIPQLAGIFQSRRSRVETTYALRGAKNRTGTLGLNIRWEDGL